MEKLLKLLNEYVGEEYLYAEIDLQEGIRDNFFHNKEGDHEIEETYIISKKFGFINRLVQNNKLKELEEYEYLEDYHGGTFSEEENTIMKLSISANPIQDLIDLLR